MTHPVNLLDLEQFIRDIRKTQSQLVRFVASPRIADHSVRGFQFLNFVYLNGPSSIPEMIHELGCSRQYAQRETARLVAAGYFRAAPNPSRKASKLFSLAPSGQKLCLRRREEYLTVWSEMQHLFSKDEVAAGIELMRRLRSGLDSIEKTKNEEEVA